MGETSSASAESKPWTKIIIFIIVAIVIVAAVVFVTIRCCMNKKKKEKKSKKTKKSTSTSKSKSQSKSKSVKKSKKATPAAAAAKKMVKPAKIAPQVPIQVKPVDETATPSSSFTAPPTTSQATTNLGTMPERDEVPRRNRQVDSSESVEQKDKVTVLCTYGKGWKAKTAPPKDFTFSIESD